MRTHKSRFAMMVAAAALLVFCLGGLAQADPFNHLSISSDIQGGATTAPSSGVSLMYVNQGSTTISAVNDGPFRTVQVKEVDYSEAQQGAGGTVAGTFDLLAVQSMDKGDFATGETVYFYKNETLTSITDNTVRPVTRRIRPGMFLQYYFVTSGATGFDKAHIIERGGEMGDGFEESPADLETTAYPGNANSGVSSHTVSEGVRWISFEYGGDSAVSLSIDGDAVSGADGGVNIGKAYLNRKEWSPQPGAVLYWNCEGAVTAFVTEGF